MRSGINSAIKGFVRRGFRPDRANPYAGDASYLIAIRPAVSDSVTITSGRVSAIANRGSGGATYNFAQSASADRPTLGAMTDGTPALVFTATNEWLDCNAFGAAFNDPAVAAWQIDMVIETSTIASAQCLAVWSTSGSNNGYQLIGTDGTGDLRIIRRHTSGSPQISTDSETKLTTGTTTVLSMVFQNSEVDAYLNGEVTYNAANYVSTSGTISGNKFAIGARNTPSIGLGWVGHIAFFGVKAWA